MSEIAAEAGVITAIVASPRAQGRFTITVDGKPFATLSVDIIERLGLRIGSCIIDRKDAIELEAAALRTYDRALSMLSSRAQSSRDLQRRLIRKGEDPTYVRKAMERLISAGLVDDASFARQLARSKLLGAGHSSRRLRQELSKRGVSPSVADEAVDDVVQEEGVDETNLAEAAARKKLRSLGGVDSGIRRRRLYGFLSRRGFDADSIRHALASVDKELSGDDLREATSRHVN